MGVVEAKHEFCGCGAIAGRRGIERISEECKGVGKISEIMRLEVSSEIFFILSDSTFCEAN